MAYLPGVQFQPYIKPYVGSANPELADTVKQLTQRYDENLQSGTALDMLAGQMASQVMPGDQDVINQKIGAIKSQLQQIAESQGGYYTARPQISQLAAKFRGDPDLAKMIDNKKTYDKEQAINQDLTAKGLKVLDFNDDNFSTVSTDKNGKKVYNNYNPQSEMMHNYHDSQAKYFDQMQADGASGGLAHAAMQGFLQTGSWQGITGAKVRAQANRALDSYLQTPEGDQQMRNYTQLQGMDSNAARQAIQKEMIATGMERVHSQSSTSYMQDPFAMLAEKAALKGTKKGKDGMPYTLEQEQTPTAVSNKDNVDAAVYHLSDPNTVRFDSLSDKQKEMTYNAMAQARRQLGPTADDIAVRTQAKKYLHGRSDVNQAPSYYAVTGSKNISDENKTFTNGNQTSRMYQDPTQPGKVFGWDELKKKLGMEGVDDEKVLKNVNVSGFYHPDHPYTNGLQGEIADKFTQPTRLTIQTPDGKTKTIVASSDLGNIHTQEFGADKFRHEVYSGDKLGTGKRLTIDGKTYFVSPTYQPSPLVKTGRQETGDGVYVTDPLGKTAEYDMEAFYKILSQHK